MMRKLKGKMILIGGIMLLIPLLGNMNINPIATATPGTLIEPAAVPNYYIENYRVYLEINGSDIYAQVNITYNVLSDYKTSGFKRFTAPTYSSGTIDAGSIKVYDDEGLSLKANYNEIEGKDRDYIEITFEHPGFTGIKTICMNFTLLDCRIY